MASADPRLLMTNRPGATFTYSHAGQYTVSINALGHRGPARTAAKPEDTFRIICVGGSNVYGAALDDHETWPAQLEALLNSSGGRRHEVWNLGVSGYNNRQLNIVGREAIQRYDPDLVIYAPTNRGPRFFYGEDSPIHRYYRDDPSLWLELIPSRYLGPNEPLSRGTALVLLRWSGIYRFFMAARLSQDPARRTAHFLYLDETRAFFKWARARTPVVIFTIPGKTGEQFKGIHQGLDLPVLDLDASGKPPGYRDVHPTAEVMAWYAASLESWLRSQKLLN